MPINKDVTVSDCVLVRIMNCAVGERPNNLILLHYEELLVSKCGAISYKHFRGMCCLYLQVTRAHSEDRGSTFSCNFGAMVSHPRMWQCLFSPL
jgi:hypothetical protein